MPGNLSTLRANYKSQTPTVVEERVLTFLSRVPPFQFLPEPVLTELVSQIEMHYFPEGEHILSQDGSPPAYLYIIERGGVRKSLRTELAEEALVEVAGEGELFGVLSSLAGEASRLDVVALADTLCYAIPQVAVEQLLETQPAFAHYLLDFSVHHYLDWSLNQLRRRTLFTNSSDRLLFTAQVRELARRPLVTCPATAAIRSAAQLMSSQRIGSVVVTDEAGEAIGIMTDRDLRERVIAAGGDPASPVREIMSAPLRTIDGTEALYEAMRLMLTQHLHHLVVTENDRPSGILTSHDLLMLQSNSTLYLAREIDYAPDPAALRRLHHQAQQNIPMLLHQGLRAGQICRLLADLNDRLVARILKLAEAQLGLPPQPYCWLVLGSEGRREQTFKTDQDNALIYVDPPPERADQAQAYFLKFGQFVVAALIEIGFPPCPGEFMASNFHWVQPLSGWQAHFEHWVSQSDPAEIVEALLFFDLRGVQGELGLVEQLRRFITQLLAGRPGFLTRLAHLSIRHAPPLGFFGQFTFEHEGPHQHELDLKHRGIVPLVDLVRFLALQHGLNETNTLGRLELLKAAGHLPASLADNLAQAYEFMLHLRIRGEWSDLQAGRVSTGHLNPNHLSHLDRRLLKESFKAIAQAQDHLRQAIHQRVGRIL
jgi:CBS domain-containing protein